MESARGIITFSDRQKISNIRHTDILYITSSGMCCLAHTTYGRYSRSTHLGVIEDELNNPQMFFRVHTSCIVNRYKIIEYLKTDGGILLMTDSTRINIARRRLPEFLDWYKYKIAVFQ